MAEYMGSDPTVESLCAGHIARVLGGWDHSAFLSLMMGPHVIGRGIRIWGGGFRGISLCKW